MQLSLLADKVSGDQRSIDLEQTRLSKGRGHGAVSLPRLSSAWGKWLGVLGALVGSGILAVTFGLVPAFAPATNSHSTPLLKPQVVPASPVIPSRSRGDMLNPEALSRLGEVSNYESEPAAVSNSAPRSDFSIALWRLSRALDRFPQSKPQEIVNKVNRKASAETAVCPFEWSSGEPSLLLDRSSGVGLASALNQCASAVEQFHQ